MATNAGVLALDVVPNTDKLGPALTDAVNNGPAGAAAQRAGETLATRIGGGLQKFGDQIGGELGHLVSTAGRGFEQIGTAGDHLGAKLLAVGGAAVGLGTALQVMGSAESAAQQQLQAAITATGQSWGDYEVRIEAAIRSGENFGQNAIQTQNALQALTAATNDPAKALRFLQVAFDLAAARHIDLVSAANLVARALTGNARLLKQYGIDTTGVAHSTEAAAGAVTKLGEKLSGQATASVNTFSGQLEVVRTKLGDLVGALAGPVGAGLQGFGAATALVGGIVQSGFITRIRTAIVAAEGFGSRLRVVGGMLLKGGLWGLAITASVGLLMKFIGAHQEAQQKVDDLTQAIIADSGALGDNTREAVYNQLAKDGLIKKARESGVALYTYVDAVLGVTSAQVEMNRQLAEGFRSGGSDPAADYQAFALNAQDLRNSITATAGPLKDAIQGAKDHALATKADGQAAADATGPTGALGVAVGAQAAAVGALIDRNAGVLTSQRNVVNTTNALRFATQLATDKILALRDAQLGSQLSALQWKDNLVTLTDTIKNNGKTLSENTTKGRANREALLGQVQTVLQGVEAAHAQGKSYDSLAPKYALQIRQIEQSGIKAGLTKTQVDKLLAAYKTLPPQVSTKVLAPGLDAVLSKAQKLQAAFMKLPGVAQLGLGVSAPSPLHPAGGGLLVGGGTSTSDSIPLMGSRGEIMLSARTVERVGANKLLRMNAGQDVGLGGATHVTNVTVTESDAGRIAAAITLANRKSALLYPVG